MAQRTFVAQITVPKHIRRVKISKAQRIKYFEWNGTTIKCGSKKLWKKCIDSTYERDIILNSGNILPQYLKREYVIVGFYKKYAVERLLQVAPDGDSQFIVWDASLDIKIKDRSKIKYILCKGGISDFEKIIANPSQAGEPRYQIINGNYIYNHTASPFTTGKVFDAIKEMYYNKFKSIPYNKLVHLRHKLSQSYPLQIEMEIHDTVKNAFDNTKKGHGRIWDVGNRADPYMKTFLDFITKGYLDVVNLIEEDDRLHVTTGNNAYFHPVEHEEDRKLIFKFYHDENPLFKAYLDDRSS